MNILNEVRAIFSRIAPHAHSSSIPAKSALLALPNETIQEIIEDVCPDDLINFSLSCKQMLVLSRSCLKLHRERQETYAVVRFLGCPRHNNDAHNSTLLREILDDWTIAFYPRSIIIECYECHRASRYDVHEEGLQESDGDEDGEDGEDVEETKDTEAVEGTEDAEDAEDFEDIDPLGRVIKSFQNAIMKKIDETDDPPQQALKVKEWGFGKRGAMLGLLLTMLPNLEDLTLRQYMWGANTLRTILWCIAETNRDPDYIGPIILSKLKTGRVLDFDINASEDTELFSCFASLPSMETLCGNGVEMGWVTDADNPDRRWPCRDNHSPAVSAIKFEESAISFEYFSRLLRGITRLRSFSYDFMYGDIGTDPYQLIDLLLLHSRKTLECLELERFSEDKYNSYEGAGDGSLRGFEVLKDVYVHCDLWAPHANAYGANFFKRDSQAEKNAIIPLVEALPSSIETVMLEGEIHMRDIDRLLTGLTGRKGRRLRGLKKITFRHVETPSAFWEQVAGEWKEGCAKKGVILELEWPSSAWDFGM